MEFPILQSRNQLERLVQRGTVDGQLLEWDETTGKIIPSSAVRVYSTVVSVASAAILTLNGTPVDVVAAPWENKAIVVFDAIAALTYATAAYDTNVVLQLLIDTATNPVFVNDEVLGHSASTIGHFERQANIKAQIVANKKLTLKVGTGNPANGGGSLKVAVFYGIIDLS